MNWTKISSSVVCVASPHSSYSIIRDLFSILYDLIDGFYEVNLRSLVNGNLRINDFPISFQSLTCVAKFVSLIVVSDCWFSEQIVPICSAFMTCSLLFSSLPICYRKLLMLIDHRNLKQE